MPILTYRFRLKPTAAQHQQLEKLARDQCRLYNAALEERISAWQKKRLSIGLNDQTKSLTEVRGFDPDYGNVAYNLSKWTLKRLDDAFKGFYRRVKAGQSPGFPRFRSVSRWDTIGLHQLDGLRVRDEHLQLLGLTGKLRYRHHRKPPEGSIPKSATFTRHGGIWTVAIAYDVPAAALQSAPADSQVGIDIGIENLATLSDGTTYANPRSLKAHAKKVAKRQRAVARTKRGSKGRRKRVDELGAATRKIYDTRTAHLHMATRAITRKFSLIAVEDLQLQNLTRSAKGTLEKPGRNVRQKSGLNRALLDAAPGRFIQMLEYKAESAGGRVIKVDARNTSQECSGCGLIVAKSLKDRMHQCPHCGLVRHRDHNAAINILNRAFAPDAPARRRGDYQLAEVRRVCPGTTDAQAA